MSQVHKVMTNATGERRVTFNYRIRAFPKILLSILLSLVALYLFLRIFHHPGRIVLAKGIGFPVVVSQFLWLVASLAVAWLVFRLIRSAWSSGAHSPKLIITDAELLVPYGITATKYKVIPVSSIRKLSTMTVTGGQVFLFVEAEGVGVPPIMKKMFDSPEKFQAMIRALQRSMAQATLPPAPQKVPEGAVSPGLPQPHSNPAPAKPVMRPVAPPKPHPADAAMKDTIERMSKEDPLTGPKVAAFEIRETLLRGMKGPKGVHIESLLCALGALAGYACQASARAEGMARGDSESALFRIVQTADGTRYFYGDSINRPLAELPYSVWGLTEAAARHHGAINLPDRHELFTYVTQTVGTSQFGIPRLPEGHGTGDTPVNYVTGLWGVMSASLKRNCRKPSEWPIAFALVIQQVIGKGKDTISPELAFRIVMESAIPMSKMDFN